MSDSGDNSYFTETSYDDFFCVNNIRTKNSKDLTHKVWWNSSLEGNSKIKTNYYSLNEDQNIDFMKNYLQSICKKELNIGIYTKCGFNKPLYIQFSMKFSSGVINDIYDNNIYDFIKFTCNEVCEIIGNRYILSDDKTEFISVVTYPKKQRKGEFNFRIIFPYFWTNKEEVTRQIIPTLKKALQIKNAYRILTVFPTNEQNMIGYLSDDFLPLYMTNEEGIIYNEYFIFENNNEIDINDVFILENCEDELMEINIDDQNQKLSLFISIYHWKKPNQINKNSNLISPMLNISASSSTTDDSNYNIELSNVFIFQEIYKLIGVKRKSEAYFIEDMASILKTIFANQEGYIKWKELFPQSTLIPIIDDWYKYNNENLTINTLLYYASIDSKKEYSEWYNKHFIQRALQKAFYEQYDANIAKAFKVIYPFEYVCVSHKQSTWYYYCHNKTNPGIWYEMDNDVDINNKLSSEFFDYFKPFRDEENNLQDKNGSKKYESKYEKLSKILLSTGSKKSIISELKTLYHNKKFLELLDSETYLTATNNYILDARYSKIILRDGRPEDYISLSTGIPYMENPTGMNDFKLYFKQLFIDKGIRRFMKYMFASFLTSGNKDKIFPIMTGEGNNSKSILVSIVEKALGRYAGKVPTSLIVGKRTQSSGATPELKLLIKCRVVFAQEPSKDETLNIGLIKEITGNDTLYTRQLFREGEVSKVNSLIVMVCNKIPRIPDNQEAIWERIRVVPFKSKWVNNPPEGEEEQFKSRLFKKDKYFETKKTRMAICLLKIMIDKYEKYKENGLHEPREMYLATKHLREKTNMYQIYVNERIDRIDITDEENYKANFISISELHQAFTNWFKMEYKGNKPPTRTTFIDEIEGITQTKLENNKVYGFKWKNIVEESSSSSLNSFNSMNNIDIIEL